MNRLKRLIRRYPAACFCFLVIWFLSFFTPPKTELDEVEFIDKWVHIIMYGGACMMLWIEYWRSHRVADYRKLTLWAWTAPIVMSGIIELLQEYCTDHRSGDWIDLAANAAGVTLAAIVGIIARAVYQKVIKN